DFFAAPAAGQSHLHLTVMRRATPFGDRIRHLACTTLRVGHLTDDDTYGLFGNVVLDPTQRLGAPSADGPAIRGPDASGNPGPPASPRSRLHRNEGPSRRGTAPEADV
ncbi:MAG: hypothetical protein OXG16_12000, partial [Rhodospirillales bacterium]|nr:hypothetical protein [Rhodospirillales bacterium]